MQDSSDLNLDSGRRERKPCRGRWSECQDSHKKHDRKGGILRQGFVSGLPCIQAAEVASTSPYPVAGKGESRGSLDKAIGHCLRSCRQTEDRQATSGNAFPDHAFLKNC